MTIEFPTIAADHGLSIKTVTIPRNQYDGGVVSLIPSANYYRSKVIQLANIVTMLESSSLLFPRSSKTSNPHPVCAAVTRTNTIARKGVVPISCQRGCRLPTKVKVPIKAIGQRERLLSSKSPVRHETTDNQIDKRNQIPNIFLRTLSPPCASLYSIGYCTK